MPQFFDIDSKFGQAVFEAVQDQGEAVEFKASFFLNGMEGDIIGFESLDNLYEEPEYRIVESIDQFRSICAMVFQNMAQIEAECDLKNALEVCHIAVSLRSRDTEINFVFLPVFPKNFKISENYSSWVQLKSIIRSGDAGSPTKGTAISTFLKYKLLSGRITFVCLVESAPEKHLQSTTILEETGKLLNESRSVPISRRRPEDSMKSSRQQMSERSSQHQSNEELDTYAKQVIQEVTHFATKVEDQIDFWDSNPGTIHQEIEDLQRQLDILDQKIEIANESSKSAIIKQRLLRSQNKLSQLREAIEIAFSSSKRQMKASNRSQQDTIDRAGILQQKPRYSAIQTRQESFSGLPPRAALTSTRKKQTEFEGVKKFHRDDYKGSLLLHSSIQRA